MADGRPSRVTAGSTEMALAELSATAGGGAGTGAPGVSLTSSALTGQVAAGSPAPAASTPSPAAPAGRTAEAESEGILARESRRWRWLLDQLGAILLSLALAVVIWLIAVSQENPLITQDFPERIGITVRGLDSSLQPVQNLGNESVRVNVRAPRAAWDDLDAGDFAATVDLTDFGEGTHDVPVVVTVNDPRVTVLGASPPSLRIQLDPLATRTMSVTVQVMDAPAFGYDWQAPIVDPPTVTVRGPATQVDLVDQLVAPVFLLNAKSQVERTVELRAINRQNQVVTGIDLSTQFANVVVPVEQWPGRKEVAVRINLVGQPAPGYRLSTVRAEPSTVVLQGIAEVLATVPGYIETEPLSIEGATDEIRTRLNLVVPPGVTVFDGNSVQAIVSITPIEGGTTVRVQPIAQGLSPAYEATVSPELVDVILSGPVPLLESLNPDDMFVILDLTGLLPGTHVVTPRVVLPEGIRQEGVLPETVEVIITSTLPPPAPNDSPGVGDTGTLASTPAADDATPTQTPDGGSPALPASPATRTAPAATPTAQLAPSAPAGATVDRTPNPTLTPAAGAP
jgi:YbbR domain-containing protein